MTYPRVLIHNHRIRNWDRRTTRTSSILGVVILPVDIPTKQQDVPRQVPNSEKPRGVPPTPITSLDKESLK